jgi:hypothetical protein
MNPKDRIVLKIPVEKIWDDQTELDLERVSYLSKMELIQILRNGQVQFVLADVGKKLMWIDQSSCYSFWKNEIQPHFVENPFRIFLNQFRNEYAYLASQWRGITNAPVILLEKLH